ncbi:molybdenum cofactor biosynthesis protein MoaE [Brachybacterium endophyticum]|uniref:Molybdenum cofactor biosynthesis protein MoaE n=1 Tax=Brachybacterium endophyticum TaxID=2182385 RepID=A0A2U2RI06_9MICO|nr:molybdenum cofactor biosynthesis protein MoaE [Brachybacterium endophyticum]PWH05490.1 molybdenum cofactor biosynthesis protein MoaE [Brachybacterium endophyticum]
MIISAALTDAPLDISAHLDAVASPHAGATAVFVGTVRDNDPEAGGTVERLDYSAHPDAERLLGQIAATCDAPDVRIAVSHRIGFLAVGETAIVAAVSSRHRDAAFTISREVVERVKERLPVWKRQVEADGTAEWIGLGSLAPGASA